MAPSNPPNRLLDAVVEGRLKTEELLLTAEAVNSISKLHDALTEELERLSGATVFQGRREQYDEVMQITISVRKHDMSACRTVSQVKGMITGLAMEAFSAEYERQQAIKYQKEQDDAKVREDLQHLEEGPEDPSADPEPVDDPGV